MGKSVRGTYKRRENIEKKIGRQIKTPDYNNLNTRHAREHPGRLSFPLKNGIVIVGTDPHYWPDENTTAHRGLVKFIKDLKPDIVVMNGDVLDGASISRHPPINWEDRPSLIQEIEVCQQRLDEITMAAGKAKRIWTLGNHDARFETRLATVAPEYAKVRGMHLKDHFPDWEPCWDCWVNEGREGLVVKHRFKGGIHAPWNNTIYAGMHITTGHLHSLKVYPFTDYNGTRYGTDAGTLADPDGPQFHYTENGPKNWRAGFVVHQFVDGLMLWPSLAHVIAPGKIEFERKIYEV